MSTPRRGRMVAGIVLMALGLKKVLGYVGGEDGHTVADPIYGIPLAALYLLGHVGFKRATSPAR